MFQVLYSAFHHPSESSQQSVKVEMINSIVRMGKQGLGEEKELVCTRAEIQTQAGGCQSYALKHHYAGSCDRHIMVTFASVCFLLTPNCLAVCLSVQVIRNANNIVPLLKYRRKGQKHGELSFKGSTKSWYSGGRKEGAPSGHFLQPAGEQNHYHHNSHSIRGARGV